MRARAELVAEERLSAKGGEGLLVVGVDGGLTGRASTTTGTAAGGLATGSTAGGTTATSGALTTLGTVSARGAAGGAGELAVNLNVDLLLLGGALLLGGLLLGLAGEELVLVLTLEDLALNIVGRDGTGLLLGELTAKGGLLGEVLVKSLGVVLLLNLLDGLNGLGGGGGGTGLNGVGLALVLGCALSVHTSFKRADNAGTDQR